MTRAILVSLSLLFPAFAHGADIADLLCSLNAVKRELSAERLGAEELKSLEKNPERIPNIDAAIQSLRAQGHEKKAKLLEERVAQALKEIRKSDLSVSLAEIDAAFRLRCLK